MRQKFVELLTEYAKKRKEVILVTGDLGHGLFDNYRKELPSQFVNVGIAESNLINISAGLSMTGHNVFTYSISPFLLQRAFEHIKINLCHDNNDVKLLGAGGGCLYGAEGFTHHATEDVGLMKLLPNMTIVCPANYQEMEGLFKDIVSYPYPIYVRFGRKCNDKIYSKKCTFSLGKMNVVHEGDDYNTLVVSYGTMLSECYNAIKILNKKKIYPALISMHTIQPIDEKIIDWLELFDKVIIVEDHRKTGGLYSSIMELEPECTCYSISFPNKFIDDVGSADYIYDKYGLIAKKIAGKVEAIYHDL